MDLAGFDATMQEEWRPSGGLLPDGDYVAVIDQSEEKTTKRGDGSYLELRFEIIEGSFNARKLWTRLNLKNPSEKAVQIAKAELGAICKAVGVLQPEHAYDLHDKPLVLRVRSEDDGQGKLRNVIKGYKSKAEAEEKAEVPKNVRVPESVKKAKPWEKKPGGWTQKTGRAEEATPF